LQSADFRQRFPRMPTSFGHPDSVLRFWRALAAPLVRTEPTPFYLFSAEPVAAALRELNTAFSTLPVPVRHWLSCKTQPLRPLLQWWRQTRGDIEVVSEFELRAALAEGFAPENILVNGPAKHHWLPRYELSGLKVNFDSPNELRALLPLAKRRRWPVGLRLRTSDEIDPDGRDWTTQFGFPPADFAAAVKQLQRAGLPVEQVHFHLRTNVPRAAIYEQALNELAEVCRASGCAPRVVDLGGGFPPAHVQSRKGAPLDSEFSLASMREVLGRMRRQFPALTEIWLENGRWMSARSGVLVVRVLDVKETHGKRHLICDGGRTMNALVATWEHHGLFTIPTRRGKTIPTTATGPTCMAFDQLVRRDLPRRLRMGDKLVWLEAGAYHLPWETRFSHGLAGVFWHEQGKVRRVRANESFESWWGQWR
jgi:diaminopimelate decarboxylase